MSKIITMIILVSVVWQVISSIIENAAKRKEQERMRELAQRRRGAEGKSAPAAVSSRAAPPTMAHTAPRQQTRAEELAARRQAQLEELRRRRTGQSPGRTQVRFGGAGPSGTPAGAPARGRGRGARIEVRPADAASIRQAELAERQRRAQLERRRQEEERASRQAQAREEALAEARRQAEREAARRRAEAVSKAGLGRPLTAVLGPDTAARDIGVTMRRLQSALSNRQTVREVFVLKELLDPPLAERGQHL